MSNPPAPINPEIGLMFTLADHLIPLFKTGSIDTTLAHRMALSAIQAYQPETRADYVNVARTIAFSIAALALLGKATSEHITIPEQMKVFSRANALNRSADQSERTMMQRRRYQQSYAPPEQPGHASEPPASDTQIDDAEIQDAIADAIKEHAAARTPCNPKAAAPEPAPAVPRTAPPQPSVQPPIVTAVAAIRYNSQPQPTPFKAELLRNSAIQRVIAQNATQNPG